MSVGSCVPPGSGAECAAEATVDETNTIAETASTDTSRRHRREPPFNSRMFFKPPSNRQSAMQMHLHVYRPPRAMLVFDPHRHRVVNVCPSACKRRAGGEAAQRRITNFLSIHIFGFVHCRA